MSKFIITLNAKNVAGYISETACRNRFGKLKSEYPGPNNEVLVYKVETGTFYKDFPLTEENELTI